LAPSTAAIAHAPLNDTEDTVGPYPLTVTITPGTAGLVGDSVLIKFGTGSFSQTAPLLPFGNPNEYRGVIAGQGSGVSIQYYISTADSLGFHVNLPANAPADYFSFYAGPDTVAPLLVHSSVPFVDIAELPLSIQAGASDNLGVDSVWVEYTINDQSQAPFGMQRSGDEFSATFPFDSSDVAIDDSVSYRILARDVSAAMNQTVSGPHVFDIRKVLSTIQVVNKGIPDNDPSGISDTLHISEPGYSLKDLEIYLDAIHTHTGDLVVQLTAPNGTMLTLVDRPGYPATPTGSPGIHPKITLDDQAETSIEDIAFSAGQQVLGTFRPDPDLLANVNGFAYSGDWIITVSDHNAGSPGLLRNWGMIAS
ncbi:MAG: proprotein convertase P-domain-containing protein, partial [Calditrichaeota bacterium]|nr:proprotein convertase P-domain-containing protein [Calditrichota bacterium]